MHHHRDCDKQCADGCTVAAFEDWLNGPIFESERLAEERREERLQTLMRGEIPA